MENGRIKVWLPAIRARSGTDVYTRRLAAALERHGITAHITWFPLSHELLPILLQRAQPPAGTNMIIANSWNGFAFKHTGLPLLVVVHHCIFDPDLRPYKSVAQSVYHRFFAEPRETRSLRAADAVVAVSRCVAHHLWQRLSLDNVEVIYNWVDTDLFKPEKMIARGDRPFRLLFVGKPTRLKGGDMLVPLMRELGAAFELRLTAELQDCRNMNLPANIIPMGRLSEQDMVKAYQQCDALLLPSRAEGFSYAALEAMACGKPVITALPESVTDGITGVLCRIGEVHDFVEACRSLAANQVQCGEIGLKSRQGTVEKFSESEAMDRYIPLIKHLV